MKMIPLIFLLFILTACSSTSHSHKKAMKIADASLDSLTHESFYRWDEERLASNAQDNLVVGCYQGKIQETLVEYKKQFEQKDKNPYYWTHIGSCYFLDDDYKKAEFFYRLSLEEAKTNELKALAHNNLALIYLKAKQWERARDHLKQAISLDKKLKVPQFNLAQIYLQFGYYDRAIAVLKSPLWKDHQDADVNFSLANAYLFKNDLAQAEHYFKLIPEKHFVRENVAVTYSLFLLQKGDVKKAQNIMNNREISSGTEVSHVSKKVEKLLERRTIK